MNKLLIPIAGLAAALMPLEPAAATITVTTWTGTLAGGIDYPRMFGVGPSLDGVAFTAVFTTDDTAASSVISGDAYGSKIGNSLGVGGNIKAPSTTAVLTINNRSFYFGGPLLDISQVEVFDQKPSYPSDFTYVRDLISSSYGGPQGHRFRIENVVQSYDVNFLNSPDFRAPFSVTAATGITFSGGFDIDGDIGTYSQFRTTGVTSRIGGAVGGVPEPASWALMLTGFGLVGVAARRRQRYVAA